MRIATIFEFRRKFKMKSYLRLCLKKKMMWIRNTPACWGISKISWITRRSVCWRKKMEKVNKNCKDQSCVELRKMEMNLLLDEKKKWEVENKTLKEKKNKLKYTLFDLLKASDKTRRR
jgi:hypothetical protein